jgi:hypothetical protein
VDDRNDQTAAGWTWKVERIRKLAPPKKQQQVKPVKKSEP